MNKIKSLIKKIIPKNIFEIVLPFYHFFLAFVGAVWYHFPSKEITVIGITGTKGKTSTAEILNAILEASGKRTALLGTLRFKYGNESVPNMYKMTMPGRFFVQKFLRKAVDADCNVAIIEMTSQGAVQHRHKFVEMDALIFTNIAPEHIESHGSYENYVKAKLSIGEALLRSKKPRRVIVANSHSREHERFLSLNIPYKIPYSIDEADNIVLRSDGSEFEFEKTKIRTSLVGRFNIENIIGASRCAMFFGANEKDIVKGLEKLKIISGRGEHITLLASNKNASRQNFEVIVDYAHTPDSLQAIYQAFESKRKICVLGNTGGGRDTWKRPEMGKIADTFCSKIILTNEDPYDEDPLQIVNEMKKGMHIVEPEIIMDRREAISKAISSAKTGDVVIITGKGTDPYIMGPNGSKQPWDDATVAREELEKVLGKR